MACKIGPYRPINAKQTKAEPKKKVGARSNINRALGPLVGSGRIYRLFSY